MTLFLTWKGQFEVMKRKVHTAITKLINMQINPFQAAIFYHTYIIKSTFFSYRVVKITDKQDMALRKVYEELLLLKLGLSRNFSKKVLYSRKSALGIQIMTLSTIIAVLKAKLYLGNMRTRGVINEAV